MAKVTELPLAEGAPVGSDKVMIEKDGELVRISLFDLSQYLASDPVAPPVFTGQPSISTDGSPMVGELVTLNFGTIEGGTVAGAELLRGAVVIDDDPGGSYVLVSADEDEQLRLRVTASGAGGSTIATSAAIGPISGAPPILGPAFRDDFSTSGNLNGRTGWTVQTVTGQSSQINNIVAADGAAGSTGNGGATAFITAANPLAVVQRRLGLGAFGSRGIAEHVTIAPLWSGLGIDCAYNTTGNTPTGLTTLRRFTDGTATSIAAVGERIEPGDVVRTAYSLDGANTLCTIFVNGWQIGAPSIVSGFSFTLNGNFGLIGGPNMAGLLDDIQVSDPATEAWIGLRMAGRVLPRNTDNSVTVRVRGVHNLAAPAGLLYTLIDRSTGADVPVTGHVRQPLLDFAAADGAFSGAFTVSAANLASDGPFVVQVFRTGLVGGAEAVAFSPRWRPGHIAVQTGQSLGVDASRQSVTTSPSYTAPAGSFWINGEPTNVSTLGASFTRRMYPVGNNTAAAAFAEAFGGRVMLAAGGVSNQPVSALGVGSAAHLALLEAIERAGGFAHICRVTHGQSDLNTNQATYIAGWEAIFDDIEAQQGAPIKVLWNPIASSWYQGAFHDIRWQSMRRVMDVLIRQNPDRYFAGANALDLQHRDNLHFNNNGMGQQAWREGHAARRALGLASTDRNGPSLASVTKVSATEVRCVYNLNGAASLELVNTGYASNFNGGMIFSTAATLTSTTIATKIGATGATVDASPSGGQQGINFTFPGGTFPGSVFVWAAYGMNPFNPADNGTATDPVNLDMATRASMIRAVRAGEQPVALQPYFTVDGTDYMVAS